MNTIALILGYGVLIVGCLFIVSWFGEYLSAAKWYFTRFNSNKIYDLEDVICDAKFRIEQLKNEKLK
jgi:RecJ-like exonuclease